MAHMGMIHENPDNVVTQHAFSQPGASMMSPYPTGQNLQSFANGEIVH